jgi:UDP-N-acetylglucosamine--N-acetylmuramyl-(pentapeptide) pyrophosphoryl-undecaprenol N-acetylglucosamine transferase
VKAVCTGNPLRSAFVAQAKESFEKEQDDTLKLLVIGGSQGAKILNEVVPEAVALLAQKSAIQVKHQTGSAMQAEVSAHYQQLNAPAEALAFVEDMVAVYRWADVIVCRAGAMTVSEVAAMGLPCVFIPLANAIDDHQTANARYLAESNAAYILKQAELTAERLADLVLQAMNKQDSLRQAALNCARLQATHDVANICMQEAK